MQPVNRALRRVFGHALDAVIVGPAVVTIQITLPLGEEIGNDGAQLALVHERFEIGRTPGFPRANGVEFLILFLAHRLRVWMNRVRRLRQDFRLRQRLESRIRR